MTGDLKKQIIEYMELHSICTVATVKDDQPYADAVEYVNDGTTLYFISFPKSQKTANIRANSRVAITINESVLDMRGTQGIQYSGEAKLIEDKDFALKISKMFLKKFTIFKLISWDLSKALFVKVTPKRIDFINYRKKFGHKESLVNF